MILRIGYLLSSSFSISFLQLFVMEKDVVVGGGKANFGNVDTDTVFIRVYRLSLRN